MLLVQLSLAIKPPIRDDPLFSSHHLEAQGNNTRHPDEPAFLIRDS